MIGIHVKTEMRINLLGAALFSLIFTPAVVLAIGKRIDDVVLDSIGVTVGTYMIVSMTAGMAALVIIQLSSEMMVDRSSGVLLRVRSLPNGPIAWSIGKSISVGMYAFLMQLVILIGGLILLDSAQLDFRSTVLTILVMLFSLAAHAPLGPLLGIINRGVYSNVAVVLIVLAIFATSGIAFPIDIMPEWVQAIQLVLPTFWSGHLVRSVTLPAQAGAGEIIGSFQPVLASGILAAWLVVGFAAVAFLIKRFFRQESIGAMQKMQTSLRSQLGA